MVILELCKTAKKASVNLASLSSEIKNSALYKMANALEKNPRKY